MGQTGLGSSLLRATGLPGRLQGSLQMHLPRVMATSLINGLEKTGRMGQEVPAEPPPAEARA